IIGMGRIGRAVAKRAAAFDLKIVYANPRPIDGTDAVHVTLEQLLAESDFVSLHCPLSASTRGLIGARQLAPINPTPILVAPPTPGAGRTGARGAPPRAAAPGPTGGAGPAVYAEAPRAPEALRRAPRVVVLPHIGSATRGPRARMATLAAEAVRDVLAGREP